jgi:hypothetical protein
MPVHCSLGNLYVLSFWLMVLGLNDRRRFHSSVVRSDHPFIPDHLLTIYGSSFGLGPILTWPKVSIHSFHSTQLRTFNQGTLRDRLCGPSGTRVYRCQLSCCVVLLPS